MNPDTIDRREFEEFGKRIDEENHRQNRRIELLEDNVRQVQSLAGSVEKLATNMENMVKEQERQGQRLEKLESRDGDMWRTAVKYVMTVIIGIVVGYAATRLGF